MIVKAFLTTLIILFAYNVVQAQTGGQPGPPINIRICAPSRGNIIAQKPLFVIFSNGKEIMRTHADTSFVSTIKPEDIQSISVVKDAYSVQKYGKDAVAGVCEIYMKDGKYPDGYPKQTKKDTITNKH